MLVEGVFHKRSLPPEFLCLFFKNGVSMKELCVGQESTSLSVGYSCQSVDKSIVGFCCTEPSIHNINNGTNEKESDLKDLTKIVNEGYSDDLKTEISPTTHLIHTYAYDLMTVLSCPYELTPSYLINSQIIMECTKTDQLTNSCPAPAMCVRAPRDVLKRSICCSGSVLTYNLQHKFPTL
ncbi:unnamed protein product [Strongylus vulgaris]|uniref:Uncharacterized protein n=1 Tax=Strongylus vulgaris TaxID=40348 RepID=A0A3P7LNU7_STRVU|nr:unnamed protein product [Strongylus vulgaris]